MKKKIRAWGIRYVTKLEFKTDIEFTGFTEIEEISKPDVEGEKLWKYLFTRNPSFGGVSCNFYGVPGSGKTSLMLRLCRKIFNTYPNETIFWRENHNLPIQILKLGLPVNFFTDNKLKIQIKELTPNGPIPTKDYKARIFRSPKELIDMIEPGVINCVYYEHRTGWLKLMDRMKTNHSWQSFFIDEGEDLFPAYAKDKEWHLNTTFSNSFKELRKCRISIYCNSQTDWDFDPRIKSKLMLEVFLYGAKKNKDSPLLKSVVQDIQLGQGWIVYARSRFGKFTFDPVEPLEKMYIAIPKYHKGVKRKGST